MSSHEIINNKILVVDLDGTLLRTDVLQELLIKLVKTKPYLIFLIPIWLYKGKANLKYKLSKIITLDIESLPFNETLINWLKEQKGLNKKIVLCTGTYNSYAHSISDHIGIFDEVLSSDKEVNLVGKSKKDFLVKRFGYEQYNYVGNSFKDIPVWEAANKTILVSPSPYLTKKIRKLTRIDKLFQTKRNRILVWIKLLRIYQWAKNLLLFAPLIAANHTFPALTYYKVTIAFFAFSALASSVYILNDLLDLKSDREHLRKKERPFASGDISIASGMAALPVLISLSFYLATQVNQGFVLCMASYFIFTCSYSWILKRIILVDCLVLTLLYTLRVISGAFAAEVYLSSWLIAFSIFLFLSLALIKRYSELKLTDANNLKATRARGYSHKDLSLIWNIGISSGFIAILVLAFYLDSEKIKLLYENPMFIWGTIPTLMLWISWMWLQAHRGNMYDDPILFALKDKTSLISCFLFLSFFMLA